MDSVISQITNFSGPLRPHHKVPASYARPSPHTSPLRGFRTWYLKEWEGPGGVATKDWIPTTASSDTLVWGSSFNLGDYSGAGKPTKRTTYTWVLKLKTLIWDDLGLNCCRLTLDFSAPQMSFWSPLSLTNILCGSRFHMASILQGMIQMHSAQS